jgi:hypothetical protein
MRQANPQPTVSTFTNQSAGNNQQAPCAAATPVDSASLLLPPAIAAL